MLEVSVAVFFDFNNLKQLASATRFMGQSARCPARLGIRPMPGRAQPPRSSYNVSVVLVDQFKVYVAKLRC